MHVQKLFLPVMLGILLIIAILPPVSAGNQFSDLNTAAGIGALTAGTGTFPAFISPAAAPAPFASGDSSDLRTIFRSPRAIENLQSINYVPADYSSQISSSAGRSRSSGMSCNQAYRMIKR
jgi:hypothetical protein